MLFNPSTKARHLKMEEMWGRIERSRQGIIVYPTLSSIVFYADVNLVNWFLPPHASRRVRKQKAILQI
jgi:hypothetical protein